VWLALALAYVRLGDSRAAELALSEANLCDPEHPGVWGHLALLALQQVCVLFEHPLVKNQTVNRLFLKLKLRQRRTVGGKCVAG
jgi:hypothetical protein